VVPWFWVGPKAYATVWCEAEPGVSLWFRLKLGELFLASV